MLNHVLVLLMLLAAAPASARDDLPVETVAVDLADVSVLDLVLWASDTFGFDVVLGDTEALRASTVTVVTHRPLPMDQAWDLVHQALQAGGFALVFAGDVARVVPIAAVAVEPLPVRVGPPAEGP